MKKCKNIFLLSLVAICSLNNITSVEAGILSKLINEDSFIICRPPIRTKEKLHKDIDVMVKYYKADMHYRNKMIEIGGQILNAHNIKYSKEERYFLAYYGKENGSTLKKDASLIQVKILISEENIYENLTCKLDIDDSLLNEYLHYSGCRHYAAQRWNTVLAKLMAETSVFSLYKECNIYKEIVLEYYELRKIIDYFDKDNTFNSMDMILLKEGQNIKIKETTLQKEVQNFVNTL